MFQTTFATPLKKPNFRNYDVTDDEIIEIRKRANNARNGPWKSFVEGRDHYSGSNFIRVGSEAEPNCDIELSGVTIADQDFIAHARSDVPKLLAEIERLKGLID